MSNLQNKILHCRVNMDYSRNNNSSSRWNMDNTNEQPKKDYNNNDIVDQNHRLQYVRDLEARSCRQNFPHHYVFVSSHKSNKKNK